MLSALHKKTKLVLLGTVVVAGISVTLYLVLRRKHLDNTPSTPSSANVACPKDAQGNPCANNGTCEAGKCACNTGWTGPACTEVVSPCKFTKDHNGKKVQCSGRGTCNNGVCDCDRGYHGPNCEKLTPLCPSVGGKVCYGHGTCNVQNGKCECDSGWGGLACQYQPTCPGTGETGGPCNSKSDSKNTCKPDGSCACASGYYGFDCTATSPNQCPGNGCSGHGTCNDTNATCVCNLGWAGPACDIPVPVNPANNLLCSTICPNTGKRALLPTTGKETLKDLCPEDSSSPSPPTFPNGENPQSGWVCSNADNKNKSTDGQVPCRGQWQLNRDTWNSVSCMCFTGYDGVNPSGTDYCGGCSTGYMQQSSATASSSTTSGSGSGDDGGNSNSTSLSVPLSFEGVCIEACPGLVTISVDGSPTAAACYGNGQCMGGGNCSCYKWPDQHKSFCPLQGKYSCKFGIDSNPKRARDPKPSDYGTAKPAKAQPRPGDPDKAWSGPFACVGLLKQEDLPTKAGAFSDGEYCFGNGTCSLCGDCSCAWKVDAKPETSGSYKGVVTCRTCESGALPWGGSNPFTLPADDTTDTAAKTVNYDYGPCLACAWKGCANPCDTDASKLAVNPAFPGHPAPPIDLDQGKKASANKCHRGSKAPFKYNVCNKTLRVNVEGMQASSDRAAWLKKARTQSKYSSDYFRAYKVCSCGFDFEDTGDDTTNTFCNPQQGNCCVAKSSNLWTGSSDHCGASGQENCYGIYNSDKIVCASSEKAKKTASTGNGNSVVLQCHCPQGYKDDVHPARTACTTCQDAYVQAPYSAHLPDLKGYSSTNGCCMKPPKCRNCGELQNGCGQMCWYSEMREFKSIYGIPGIKPQETYKDYVGNMLTFCELLGSCNKSLSTQCSPYKRCDGGGTCHRKVYCGWSAHCEWKWCGKNGRGATCPHIHF